MAVQATIRSYQVRGHLAAKIDPLNLSNMSIDAAKKLIIRSVQVQEQDLDTVFQLPSTTWIGGTVSKFYFLRVSTVYSTYQKTKDLICREFMKIIPCNCQYPI